MTSNLQITLACSLHRYKHMRIPRKYAYSPLPHLLSPKCPSSCIQWKWQIGTYLSICYPVKTLYNSVLITTWAQAIVIRKSALLLPLVLLTQSYLHPSLWYIWNCAHTNTWIRSRCRVCRTPRWMTRAHIFRPPYSYAQWEYVLTCTV